MMASDNIISVSEADFEYQVIAYSNQTPVVVDFWAEWCAPCKTLGSLLVKLAQEGKGAFRLAKVNVDENPNLAIRFHVRSIPTVKAFREGQVVTEFVGALPESKLREFLRALAPSEHDLILEKGQSLLQREAWKEAEAAFRKFLQKSPHHPAGLLGFARSQLGQGNIQEAYAILHDFPPSKEYALAESLMTLIKALRSSQKEVDFSNEPLEATYLNALRLVKLGNFEAAMDGMLDILRQDKHFYNGEVRRVLLAIFDLLGDENPLTHQYRKELASVLF